jgi:hypothetical protein
MREELPPKDRGAALGDRIHPRDLVPIPTGGKPTGHQPGEIFVNREGSIPHRAKVGTRHRSPWRGDPDEPRHDQDGDVPGTRRHPDQAARGQINRTETYHPFQPFGLSEALLTHTIVT